MHGKSRNAYLLAKIYFYTREVVSHYLGYHCTWDNVKNTMRDAFSNGCIGNVSGISMRSDNCTQFICNTTESSLSMITTHH